MSRRRSGTNDSEADRSAGARNAAGIAHSLSSAHALATPTTADALTTARRHRAMSGSIDEHSSLAESPSLHVDTTPHYRHSHLGSHGTSIDGDSMFGLTTVSDDISDSGRRDGLSLDGSDHGGADDTPATERVDLMNTIHCKDCGKRIPVDSTVQHGTQCGTRDKLPHFFIDGAEPEDVESVMTSHDRGVVKVRHPQFVAWQHGASHVVPTGTSARSDHAAGTSSGTNGSSNRSRGGSPKHTAPGAATTSSAPQPRRSFFNFFRRRKTSASTQRQASSPRLRAVSTDGSTPSPRTAPKAPVTAPTPGRVERGATGAAGVEQLPMPESPGIGVMLQLPALRVLTNRLNQTAAAATDFVRHDGYAVLFRVLSTDRAVRWWRLETFLVLMDLVNVVETHLLPQSRAERRQARRPHVAGMLPGSASQHAITAAPPCIRGQGLLLLSAVWRVAFDELQVRCITDDGGVVQCRPLTLLPLLMLVWAVPSIQPAMLSQLLARIDVGRDESVRWFCGDDAVGVDLLVRMISFMTPPSRHPVRQHSTAAASCRRVAVGDQVLMFSGSCLPTGHTAAAVVL